MSESDYPLHNLRLIVNSHRLCRVIDSLTDATGQTFKFCLSCLNHTFSRRVHEGKISSFDMKQAALNYLDAVEQQIKNGEYKMWLGAFKEQSKKYEEKK